FFFQLFVTHLYLLSFPTRRSSDLFSWNSPLYKINSNGTTTSVLNTSQTISEIKSINGYLTVTTPSVVYVLNEQLGVVAQIGQQLDRKSTRLNSSHVKISYAVFCLK